jgi:nitrogen regulatory protein PII
MDHKRRGDIKKTANALEKALAKELGCGRVPGSGSIMGYKGDIQSDNYLIDSKNTEKSVIVLKKQDLIKITEEGREAARVGHLILTFLPDQHYAVVPKSHCLFDSTEEPIVLKSTKSISKTHLSSLSKRAFKSKTIPSLSITFHKPALGTYRDWLLIPFDVYKEHFFNSEED